MMTSIESKHGEFADNGCPLFIVHATSILDGSSGSMEIGIDLSGWEAWQKGTLIQNALPLLNTDEREFLMSGILPDDFDSEFQEEEE